MSSTIRRAEAAPTRREFLYYLGGASMALFAAGAGAVVYKVAQVRSNFRNNPEVFEFDVERLSTTPPIWFRNAQAFIIVQNGQLFTLDTHCTFVSDRAIVKWAEVNNLFACPVCGSMFRLDGSWITGPAPRGLDRLVLHVETPDGIVITSDDGSPIAVDQPVHIWVDPRYVIPGPPRA